MRVRVILDCDWDDLQHALDMVIAAKPSFDRSCRGPGWGWQFGCAGKPSVFVRRTKQGYSATAVCAAAPPQIAEPVHEGRVGQEGQRDHG